MELRDLLVYINQDEVELWVDGEKTEVEYIEDIPEEYLDGRLKIVYFNFNM